MKGICCLLALSFLISCSSCAQTPPAATASAITPQESTTQTTAAPTIPTPSEPTYLIGTVTSLEDIFVYVRVSKNIDSEVVGAAVIGIDFLVAEQDDEWCMVIYDDDEAGYIQTKYLEIRTDTSLPPIHKAYYYLPAKEEMGLVGTKFNNRLTVSSSTYTVYRKAPGTASETSGTNQTTPLVEVIKTRLDVYTESGTLMAEDAVLVLRDATITAPALPVAAQPQPGEASAAASETIAPTPTSTPVPIKIVIKDGKIVSSQGIALDANSPFVIGEDSGQVLSEDNTVIASKGSFLKNAAISVTYGSIYTSEGKIEIEPDYYFVPKLLKDNLVDVARYSSDIKIDLLLAKDDNFLGKNVYGKAACFLQKGTLDKLMEAQKKFAEDGYTIIIYDAYRPYSVTVMLYEKYQNGTYVAGPRIGSVHNKGAAIDMSLLDKNGNPIEMPSPIHTLDSSSNRDNKNMSDTARANMDYMADVMRSCGFTTINSEWWHFSDTEYNNYLRTDHDLKTVLQVIFS